jgi:15-cis-phytoene synthase
LRPAFDALFDIDDAMGDVVANATQPALAAIKLAWWRDALEALDSKAAPAEPRLQAAAAELLPRELSGADLAQLEEGWALLLRTDEPELFMKGVRSRGPAIFGLAARLLGVPLDVHAQDAAHAFAAADLARRKISDLPPSPVRSDAPPPRSIRPLTAFGALARRDMHSGGPNFEPEATPGRAWTLLRHRLTGR